MDINGKNMACLKIASQNAKNHMVYHSCPIEEAMLSPIATQTQYASCDLTESPNSLYLFPLNLATQGRNQETVPQC